MSFHRPRTAFTFMELMVVIAIIGILIALLLPAVQAAREAARRMSCCNNLRQVAIGLSTYHDLWNVFPYGKGGTGGGTPLSCNRMSLSGWVPLLPHLGQEALFDQISESQTIDNIPFSPFGPEPDPAADPGVASYTPWQQPLAVLGCPSDDGFSMRKPGEPGRSNYCFSRGDSIGNNSHRLEPRGVFGYIRGVNIAEITDGTSFTIAVSERVIARQANPTMPDDSWILTTGVVGLHKNPSLCFSFVGGSPLPGPAFVSTSGRIWANGWLAYTGFTTVLSPNTPGCLGVDGLVVDGEKWYGWGIVPPSSRHPGGVNAIMVDGSGRFISETISCGNSVAPAVDKGPSPYGTWGALGSKNGEDVVDDY